MDFSTGHAMSVSRSSILAQSNSLLFSCLPAELRIRIFSYIYAIAPQRLVVHINSTSAESDDDDDQACKHYQTRSKSIPLLEPRAATGGPVKGILTKLDLNVDFLLSCKRAYLEATPIADKYRELYIPHLLLTQLLDVSSGHDLNNMILNTKSSPASSRSMVGGRSTPGSRPERLDVAKLLRSTKSLIILHNDIPSSSVITRLSLSLSTVCPSLRFLTIRRVFDADILHHLLHLCTVPWSEDTGLSKRENLRDTWNWAKSLSQTMRDLIDTQTLSEADTYNFRKGKRVLTRWLSSLTVNAVDTLEGKMPPTPRLFVKLEGEARVGFKVGGSQVREELDTIVFEVDPSTEIIRNPRVVEDAEKQRRMEEFPCLGLPPVLRSRLVEELK